MAIVAYLIWPLSFFMARDNPFVLHHLRQGALIVVLALGVIVLQLLSLPVHGLLDRSLRCVAGALSVGTLVLAVIGAINAASGSTKKLPFIGELGDHVPF